MFEKIKRHWVMLNKSIYTGDKYEKNLAAIGWFGLICALFGSGMSIMNVLQHKGFVTYTTILFAISGLFIMYLVNRRRDREAAVIVSLIVSAITFSYYAISGANEGFAILWTLLMPLAVCYFMSVKYGILLSLYFEALVVILFYTSLRARFDGVYTVTFMNRFPIVYLCALMITAVSMTQYHESVLVELEYTSRLQSEVREQTKVATERANQLEQLSDEMVEAFARAIDAKDKYTNGHSFRVSGYSVALAKRLGWPEERLNELRREALLHDIGKIGVPDAVLNKPGRLTDEEFAVIKSHTTIGKTILQGLKGMADIAETAAYHHERYDGRGYPEGLSAEQIPVHARVVAIADAYDAMHSDRIYRKGLSKDVIRQELIRGRGTQFDPNFLDVFLQMFENGEVD